MRRLRTADAGRLVGAWATSTLALVVAAELLPGLHADTWWSLGAAAAVAGVFGALVRPLLVEVAAAIGWVAVVAVAIAGQAVIMDIALWVVPGIAVDSFWSALAAAWTAATVGTVLSWLATAGTPESFSASLRRSGRHRAAVADPGTEGMVFVQLDGVPYPVMQWALQSGVMPTLRRWVDTRTHRLHEWTVQLPCTTPASQQGLLHGTCAGVPAFRWYDRDLGRVLVANRPADAAVIEQRVSDGRGLLADDGSSVSNLFSGDAERCSMTMSRMSLTRGSRETRKAFAWFVVRPDGFARSLARTGAEMVRERFQAARQARLDVRPRVHRSWTFALLRAVSNGLLRDMNTAIVAKEMLRGTHSIYVDLVDYDEVAHHAGGTRLESLTALTALDQVLGVLEEVASVAPRRYRMVVLSDHGQSQGEPFAARHGVDLAGLCGELMSSQVDSVAGDVESWGRAESLFDDLAGDAGTTERAARSVAGRMRTGRDRDVDAGTADVVVLGSGNLGLVYVKGSRRNSLEDLQHRWPRLVPGLAEHPGIGFVAGQSAAGPVAMGAEGSHQLVTGAVQGKDPLAPFGAHAAAMLAAAMQMPQAPDLYVNSTVDAATLEVAAFEDLVGCHGGLGGWQDRGMLLAPADLLAAGSEIVGAEQLHAVLVSMLERLGHRQTLGRPADRVS